PQLILQFGWIFELPERKWRIVRQYETKRIEGFYDYFVMGGYLENIGFTIEPNLKKSVAFGIDTLVRTDRFGMYFYLRLRYMIISSLLRNQIDFMRVKLNL